MERRAATREVHQGRGSRSSAGRARSSEQAGAENATELAGQGGSRGPAMTRGEAYHPRQLARQIARAEANAQATAKNSRPDEVKLEGPSGDAEEYRS